MLRDLIVFYSDLPRFFIDSINQLPRMSDGVLCVAALSILGVSILLGV